MTLVDKSASSNGEAHNLRFRRGFIDKLVGRDSELGLQVRGQQVRNRYRVLQDMPTDPAKIDSISTQLYEEMLKREEKDVERLQAVVDWATADECLASGLAAYFGDDDAVPGGMCGHCSVRLSFAQGPQCP